MGVRDFFTLGAIRGNRIKGDNKRYVISYINEGESIIYKNVLKAKNQH